MINDLDQVASQIEIVKKFADDTKMGQEVSIVEEKEKLQQAINGMLEWAERWGMAVNVGKCKVMHLGHGNPCHNYTMDGTVLGKTEENHVKTRA